MSCWPNKDPNEVLDYQVDWGTNILQAGETIITSVFLVESGDVTIDSDDVVGGLTTVWLSGGTDGTRCKITNRITTSDGRVYDRTRTLRIRSTA